MPDKLYVVDAHTYVWFLTGDPNLGGNARAILADRTNSFVLPAIALAEVYWLVRKGRVSIPSSGVVSASLGYDPRFRVAPLSLAVVTRAVPPHLTVVANKQAVQPAQSGT